MLFLDLQVVESVGEKPVCFSCVHSAVTTIPNRNNLEERFHFFHGFGGSVHLGEEGMHGKAALVEGSCGRGCSRHGRPEDRV